MHHRSKRAVLLLAYGASLGGDKHIRESRRNAQALQVSSLRADLYALYELSELSRMVIYNPTSSIILLAAP